jgi:hypothetical protein
MMKARIASITAENDAWLRRATAASVAAAKDLVTPQGPIRSNAQVGKLSDSEWVGCFNNRLGLGFIAR